MPDLSGQISAGKPQNLTSVRRERILMRVLVIGASGKVGGALVKSLHTRSKGDIEAVGTYFSHPDRGLLHLDIGNHEQIREVLLKLRPDVVVQCSAITYAERCEEDPELAWRVNVESTGHIVEICRDLNSKLVFISSDYVFDGEKGNYTEVDTPNPINLLGRTKVEGERLVSRLPNHLIIRTAVVLDAAPSSKSFFRQVVECVGSGETMTVPNDQVENPTLASNLADAITDLILQEEKGLLHVAGTTPIDRYNLTMRMCNMLGLEGDLIRGVPSDSLTQKAKRPKNLALNVDKAQGSIRTTLLSLDGILEGLVTEYYSYVPQGLYVAPLQVHRDARGTLTVLVSQGRRDAPQADVIREVYASDIPERSIRRAGHKHNHTDEFFHVESGTAKFVLIDDRHQETSPREPSSVILSSNYPSVLFVPKGVYHALVSIRPGTRIISIASKPYNAAFPDEVKMALDAFGKELNYAERASSARQRRVL
jgi:dTDP-4-dehydrorhamnose reductase